MMLIDNLNIKKNELAVSNPEIQHTCRHIRMHNVGILLSSHLEWPLKELEKKFKKKHNMHSNSIRLEKIARAFI